MAKGSPAALARAVQASPRHHSIAIMASASLNSEYDRRFMRTVLDAAILGPQGLDRGNKLARVVLPKFQDTGVHQFSRDWCWLKDLPVKILSSTGKFADGASVPFNDNLLSALLAWEARRMIFFYEEGLNDAVAEGLQTAWRMSSVVKMKVFIKQGKKFKRINLKI